MFGSDARLYAAGESGRPGVGVRALERAEADGRLGAAAEPAAARRAARGRLLEQQRAQLALEALELQRGGRERERFVAPRGWPSLGSTTTLGSRRRSSTRASARARAAAVENFRSRADLRRRAALRADVGVEPRAVRALVRRAQLGRYPGRPCSPRAPASRQSRAAAPERARPPDKRKHVVRRRARAARGAAAPGAPGPRRRSCRPPARAPPRRRPRRRARRRARARPTDLVEQLVLVRFEIRAADVHAHDAVARDARERRPQRDRVVRKQHDLVAARGERLERVDEDRVDGALAERDDDDRGRRVVDGEHQHVGRDRERLRRARACAAPPRRRRGRRRPRATAA